MKQSYVYILKCSDNTYYTGVTSKLTQRLFQHETGFYPDCYTAERRPVSLVFYAEFTDINFAIEKEKQIKKWSKAKKEALINGDYDDLPNLAKKKFGWNNGSRYNFKNWKLAFSVLKITRTDGTVLR